MIKRGLRNKKSNSRFEFLYRNNLLNSKRSQEVFGMQFSMIFSIIIIVAVLAVAFYVIGYFIKFQRCAQAGTFLNDLENEVKEAYESSFYDTGDDPFARPLPSSIKLVCIADVNQEGDTEEEKEIIAALRRYANQDSNVFLYPPQKVCTEGRSRYIDYIEGKEGLYCFEVNNGKVEIGIKRDYTGKVQLLQQ
jgi:hypothetical protein